MELQQLLDTVNFKIELSPGLVMSEMEKLIILSTLRSQSFNRTHTARVLGIGIRTLQRKLRQYEVDGYEIDQPMLTQLAS